MRTARPGSNELHAAPIEGGSTVEVLIDGSQGDGGNLTAAHVLVPPGGGMPEHDHGESEALVVPQSGRVVIEGGGESEALEPGAMALIGIGERVSLTNPSDSEPASLVVFFAPPAFARTLASWPTTDRQS